MGKSRIPRRSFARSGPPAGEGRSINGESTWLPTPSLAGVIVSEESVASLGAAYAAISVLAADVASVPFAVFRRNADGSKAVDLDNPLHDLIAHAPSEEMGGIGWYEAMLWHCLTRGNTYSRIRRDGYHRPESFELLDPDRTRPARTSEGQLYYDVAGERVMPADVLHVKAVGSNGIEGKSPVRQARETLGLTIGVERFGAAYFGNGINHKGILSTDEDLDETEEKLLRRQINEQHAGPHNAAKFMLLSGGVKFSPTTITAEEAQFLLTRKFQLEEICRIFRIPPSKLMAFDRPGYGMLEETNQDYFQSSLLPWLRRIQSEFTRKLFTREERRVWSVDHDMGYSLKGWMVDQANMFKLLREMGVMNADEIRAHYGWGPIEGGKAFFVPLNQAPLDKVASASLAELKGVKPDARADDPGATPPPPAGRSAIHDAALDQIARSSPTPDGR